MSFNSARGCGRWAERGREGGRGAGKERGSGGGGEREREGNEIYIYNKYIII